MVIVIWYPTRIILDSNVEFHTSSHGVLWNGGVFTVMHNVSCRPTLMCKAFTPTGELKCTLRHSVFCYMLCQFSFSLLPFPLAVHISFPSSQQEFHERWKREGRRLFSAKQEYWFNKTRNNTICLQRYLIRYITVCSVTFLEKCSLIKMDRQSDT